MRKINSIGDKSNLIKLRYRILTIVSPNSVALIHNMGL